METIQPMMFDTSFDQQQDFFSFSPESQPSSADEFGTAPDSPLALDLNEYYSLPLQDGWSSWPETKATQQAGGDPAALAVNPTDLWSSAGGFGGSSFDGFDFADIDTALLSLQNNVSESKTVKPVAIKAEPKSPRPVRSGTKRKASESEDASSEASSSPPFSSSSSSARSHPSQATANKRRTSSGAKEVKVESPEPTSATTPAGRSTSKVTHNIIEKRYRNNLNSAMTKLRDAVPALRPGQASSEQAGDNPYFSMFDMSGAANGGDAAGEDEQGGSQPASKVNKSTILLKATEYIHFLERQNEQLMQDNVLLNTRVDKLKGFVAGQYGAGNIRS